MATLTLKKKPQLAEKLKGWTPPKILPEPEEAAKMLPAMWPVFESHLPLSIHIHKQMRGFECSRLRSRALRGWTESVEYKKALAKGGPRYNLDGDPDGFVSDEHMEMAKAWLAERGLS